MTIKTTLNINRDILEEITIASHELSISRSDVIKMLLKTVMSDDINLAKIGHSVKYQKKGDKNTWHTFHIRLDVDEYEFFLDLRKFLKMSVSHILAYAVQKYLKSLSLVKTGDKKLFKNYIFHTDIKDGFRYWQMIWGFPPNIKDFYPKIT